MTKKPTVLLLPGLMCDAAVWRAQVPALAAAGYAVAIPDFRGQGSLNDMARVALAAAEGPIAVAGHSMGGRVALQAWALAPQRIERLALMDTGAHPPGQQEKDGRIALARLGLAEGMTAVAAAWLPPMLAPHRRDDEPLVRAMTEMVERCTPEQFDLQQRAMLVRPDLRPQLPGITVPTDYATGRFDDHSPPEQHAVMAEATPGARLTIFETSGHMSPAETPDEVSAFLLAWLER